MNKMKRYSIRFMLTVVISLAALQALAAPRAVIKNDTVNIDGPLYQGQSAQAVFELENQGDSPLEIKKVSPG